MTSYFVRLLLLASASVFLLRILLEALISQVSPYSIRRADSLAPYRAASMLFTLRILPNVLSVLIILAICIPSYLRFEPRTAQEEVGWLCIAVALLGLAFFGLAIYRALSALIRSAFYVRRVAGSDRLVHGTKVSVVRQSAGLALSGIVRPRLLISERAIAELSSDQLAVALRHEDAHRASRDNLKRLLILLSPAIVPGIRALEVAWAKYAEMAADDQAAAGNAERAVALAEALLLVARQQSGIGLPTLVASLIDSQDDLAVRVRRLLQPCEQTGPQFRSGVVTIAGSALLFAAIAINPDAQLFVHHLLERLLD
jgi:hypothetical protein